MIHIWYRLFSINMTTDSKKVWCQSLYIRTYQRYFFLCPAFIYSLCKRKLWRSSGAINSYGNKCYWATCSKETEISIILSIGEIYYIVLFQTHSMRFIVAIWLKYKYHSNTDDTREHNTPLIRQHFVLTSSGFAVDHFQCNSDLPL